MEKASILFWETLSGIYEGWTALNSVIGKLILHYNKSPTDYN